MKFTDIPEAYSDLIEVFSIEINVDKLLTHRLTDGNKIVLQKDATLHYFNVFCFILLKEINY